MAFHRLQLEIMQRSDDKGLFAWHGQPSAYNSMLASGPECFSRPTWSLLPEVEGGPDFDTTYALTNRGIRMSVSVYNIESTRPMGEFLSDDRDLAGNDSDGNGGGVRYELRVEELGRIVVKLREQEFGRLKIAILGNASRTTSVAVLLDFPEATRQHKRISVLKVRRLSLWKEPEILFIT